MRRFMDSFFTKASLVLLSTFFLGCGFPGENQWVAPDISTQNRNSFQGDNIQKRVDFVMIKPVLEKNCKACHTYSQDQKQFDTLVASGMVLQKVWTTRSMPKGAKANQMTDQERSLIKDYVESFNLSQNENPVIQQQPPTAQDNTLESPPAGNGGASSVIQSSGNSSPITVHQNLVQSCTGCHGSQGLSQMPGIPNLSGLPYEYIYTQLQAFQKYTSKGELSIPQNENLVTSEQMILPRPDQNKDMGQVMNSILEPLSEEELRYLASYFSLFKQEIPQNVLSQIQSSDIPSVAMSCVGCHSGQVNATGPLLFSQDKDYLNNQLKAFRNGERKNMTMEALSQSLSDEDIETLSSFFSNLNKNN